MILANGCSHTHGTAHAIANGYTEKLWPHIAGKILGDTNVVNLAKGGDSAGAIADSTIHWLETNTIKPDMVMIQWTYADRFDIPYHRLYADDPFRDGCFVDNLRLGTEPPRSDKFTYLNQYPREGMIRLTSTGSYLRKNEETDMLERMPSLMNHLGLQFPNVLYQAGYKQDVHPYYLKNHEDPHIEEILKYYKRYVDYREAYLNLPSIHNDLKHKWAMAQNHVASYCEAHNIPYYWWTTDNWYQAKFADLLSHAASKAEVGNLAEFIVPEFIAEPATAATLNVPYPTISIISPTVAPAAKTTEVPEVILTSAADNLMPFKYVSANPASYANVFPAVSEPVNVF